MVGIVGINSHQLKEIIIRVDAFKNLRDAIEKDYGKVPCCGELKPEYKEKFCEIVVDDKGPVFQKIKETGIVRGKVEMSFGGMEYTFDFA